MTPHVAAPRTWLRACEQFRTPILLVSLFLILVGSRATLIAYAGSSTPFLDEWDADAAHLLKPFLQGSLTIADLFYPINEHRILFTKLAVLSIFEVSGYWDVVLQMIVNALVNSTTVVAVAYALARVLKGSWAVAAMILSTAINAVPFGYDNIILGFNTHFYLLITFSFAALWFLADSRAWSPRWAAGLLCAVCSSLCLASGALTLAAAGGAQLLQMACGRRKGVGEWLGIAALAAITAIMLSVIPHVPQADEFKSHSIWQVLSAFVALASWPAHMSLGLVFFLPSALFLLRVLQDSPALSDPRWFNIMALGWILSQILAIAVGRGLLPLQYRYFDFLLAGLSGNIVSAFWLFQARARESKPATWSLLALIVWLGFLGVSLTQPQRHLPDKIEEWRTILANGSRNVQQYLTTGDASFLAGAPAVEIPAFDAAPLRELLDTPGSSIGAAASASFARGASKLGGGVQVWLPSTELAVARSRGGFARERSSPVGARSRRVRRGSAPARKRERTEKHV